MHGALALAALAVLAGHAAGQTCPSGAAFCTRCRSEGFGDDAGCKAEDPMMKYTGIADDGDPCCTAIPLHPGEFRTHTICK